MSTHYGDFRIVETIHNGVEYIDIQSKTTMQSIEIPLNTWREIIRDWVEPAGYRQGEE